MRGLFGAIAGGVERKSTDVSALTWAKLWGDDVHVKSGVSVNVDSALRVSTVLACARVISEGVAQLPFKLYREGKDGSKTLAKDHDLYYVLNRRPNPWMTSFQFREALTLHAVLTGNGYAFKNRVAAGGPVKELIPLVPNRVQCTQGPDWELQYRISPAMAGSTRKTTSFICVVRAGAATSAWMRCRPREMPSGSRSPRKRPTRACTPTAAQPGGVLSVKGALDDAGRARLKEGWKQFQEGLSNKFKTAVIDQEATWTPLAMTGVDSQHIETRKFQIEEICRALRVFPQMVMHSDKTSTFASAEQFFLAHVVHTLMPWIERWEQTVGCFMLDDRELDIVPKMNVTALLRGTALDRSTYFSRALGSGGSPAWMTQDEVRALDELNPLGGEAAQLPKPTNVPAASQSEGQPNA
jgi:phage portal protein BeeE